MGAPDIVLTVAFLVLLVGTGYDAYQTLKGVTSSPLAWTRERNSITQWFMKRFGVRTGALLKTIGFDLVLLGGVGVGMLALIGLLWPAVALIWVGAGVRQWYAGRTWVD